MVGDVAIDRHAEECPRLDSREEEIQLRHVMYLLLGPVHVTPETCPERWKEEDVTGYLAVTMLHTI